MRFDYCDGKIKKKMSDIKDNTPYDDVFRTMVNDLPRLTLKLINEMFAYELSEKYTGDEKVEMLENEHFLAQQDGGQEKRITDSRIKVVGPDEDVRQYHIECQSTADGSMLIRMFEYDSQIAIQESEITKQELVVHYPQSGVLYLRWTADTPKNLRITINTPGGVVTYHIPAMKIGDYSAEDIIEKDLYFLIPFYLFKYEKLIKDEASGKGHENDGQMEKLSVDFGKLRNYLDISCENGKITEYEMLSLRDMLKKVVSNLSKNAETVRKEVEEIMGGRVLEYETKTVFNEGRNKGLSEGRLEGELSKARRIFMNMIRRGQSVEDALAIAELKYEDVNDLIPDQGFKMPKS